MRFEEFVALAQDGQVQRLHIEALSPADYQYRAYIGEESICLLNEDGSPIQERDLSQARQRLRDAGDITNMPLYLVQFMQQFDDLAAGLPRLTHRVPMSIG
ncbi:DUF6482 family protein [Salinicola avicenniae]|uniref:DUF6482 family protein n=1 Tax=Salinicola avicenniae TaxID=2916836 RepID=UPI002073A73B|nr:MULTISPECIES: DUF6482 family protein [unclassified Salinicola]